MNTENFSVFSFSPATFVGIKIILLVNSQIISSCNTYFRLLTVKSIGVDWDHRTQTKEVYRISGPNHKGWSRNVDKELGNYDYLLGVDVSSQFQFYLHCMAFLLTHEWIDRSPTSCSTRRFVQMGEMDSRCEFSKE